MANNPRFGSNILQEEDSWLRLRSSQARIQKWRLEGEGRPEGEGPEGGLHEARALARPHRHPPRRPGEVLASGIVIPDTAKEKPQQGKVIAAGPGRLDDNGKRVPMDVKVGDRVLYAKYTGQEVKIDQEELIVLAEKDVLAKVE